MRIFVDTSARAALYDRRDMNHNAASRLLREFKGKRVVLFTSDCVLGEGFTLMKDEGRTFEGSKLRAMGFAEQGGGGSGDR